MYTESVKFEKKLTLFDSTCRILEEKLKLGTCDCFVIELCRYQ